MRISTYANRFMIVKVLFLAAYIAGCMGFAQDVYAAPVLSSASPNPVVVVAGGADVVLILRGSGLDQVTSCAVVRNKQLVPGIAASLVARSASSLQIKLRANPGTAAGDAQLRLMGGNNFIDVPLTAFRISISLTANLAKKTPQAISQAMQKTPATTPTNPASSSGSGGSSGIYGSRQAARLQSQDYFGEMVGYSWKGSTAGAFQGTIHIDNVQSGTLPLQLGYTYHLCIPYPLVGGCMYEHDYGTSVSWTFSAQGAIDYQYNLPFVFNFTFPIQVYPGQHIRLEPNFSWGNPAIVVTQNYEFYQTTSSWTDAPFDGLDDLSLSFTQYATKANLNGGVPAVPGFDAMPFGVDFDFFPFNQGGGEWPIGDHASMTKLGGRGSLTCSGGNIWGFDPAGELEVWVEGTSNAAWQQANEHFQIAATVLQYIPPTVPIGAALGVVRDLGKLRLNESLNGRISRADFVNFQISEMPFTDVPSNLVPGQIWDYEVPVTVKYRIQSMSRFHYPLSYNVTFDMRGIDPQTLVNEPLMSWGAGGLMDFTPWQEREIIVPIKVKVPVVSKGGYKPGLILEKTSVSSAFYKPPKKMLVTPPLVRPGVKVAAAQDARRFIRKTATVPFPKPTAQKGVPLSGHHTAILGRTSQATAAQIVDDLKSKGIDAFMVDVPGSQDKVITLGSFANANDAKLIANMLREAFHIDSNVSQVVNSTSYAPIKSDVLPKLRSGRSVAPQQQRLNPPSNMRPLPPSL